MSFLKRLLDGHTLCLKGKLRRNGYSQFGMFSTSRHFCSTATVNNLGNAPTTNTSPAPNPENGAKDSAAPLIDDHHLKLLLSQRRKDLENVPQTNPNDMFINSELRLNEIEVYGFDYDYTLAQYTDHVQHLIYDMALNYLISELRYPPGLKGNISYDPGFAVRGLHYDIEKGYLMKLDFLNNIQFGAIYFGRRPLGKEECIEAYGSLRIRKNYADLYLRHMSDIFAIPEACLISDVTHFLVSHQNTFAPQVVYEDVTRAVHAVHTCGMLHGAIIQDLPHYVNRNSDLARLLLKLKRAGKKLFLLTNSTFDFADAGMNYLMHDHLPAGMCHWMELFDVVLTMCDKPNFFGRGRPFRIQDVETGRLYWNKILQFNQGEVYVGGSLHEFMQLSRWKGNSVLYFGDHLFVDIVEPSVKEGWRTGVIIRELETEVDIQNSKRYREDLANLLAAEDLIHQCQFYDDEQKEYFLRKIKKERYDLREELKKPFNKHFGSVFRTHTNATMFAYLMQRYADVYTSKIENFLKYPLDYSFYPSRNYLPHEFKLN